MNWKYLIMENIKLDGGHLSLEQLNAIFRTIPQEMDVLDENDRVVWSSMNEKRLFKRTEKDIGKTVFEVHPGHSQKHVKEVLDQMHAGKRKNISIMITKERVQIRSLALLAILVAMCVTLRIFKIIDILTYSP